MKWLPLWKFCRNLTYIEMIPKHLSYQLKNFDSNLNWHRPVRFQHLIYFNQTQIAIIVIRSHFRLSKLLHMSTGLQMFKQISLCKWIFNDRLFSIFILMIRIRNSNMWTKNVSIKKHIIVFGIILLSLSQKTSYFKSENSLLHFLLIHSINWKSHLKLVRCEIMILWNKTNYWPQKNTR